MRALYAQLPNDYIRLNNGLSLARKTWQLFGISYKDLSEWEDYDIEMLKLAISGVE